MKILANAFGLQASSPPSSVPSPSAGGKQKVQLAWADMSMPQRWEAALTRQKRNKRDEWLCRDCHSTNFMNKQECRTCGCTCGYPLPAAGPPPTKKMATAVRDMLHKSPSAPSPAPSATKVEACELGAPVAETEWVHLPLTQLKSEEVKLEHLRDTLVNAGMSNAAQEVSGQLHRLGLHCKGQRQQGQALDQAIAAHRRATTQREKLQAQMAGLYRQLDEAHQHEAQMAEEEQLARANLQTQPPIAVNTPTLPVMVVEQTANRLHQELASAGTLPSASQLSAAMVQIMETAWQQMMAATQQAMLSGAQQQPFFMAQPQQQQSVPQQVLQQQQHQQQQHLQQVQQQQVPQQQQQPPPTLPRTGHLGSGAPTQVDESQMSQSVLQALPAGGSIPAYPTEWGSPSQPMNMDGQ